MDSAPASFGDIFDMFFGNVRGAAQRRRAGPQRGSDLRYDLEITLEEAFAGTTKEIEFDRLAQCDVVPRQRRASRHDDRRVRALRRNRRRAQRASHAARPDGDPDGVPALRRRRPRDRDIPANAARGRGRRETETRLTVTVPAGVDDGSRIRIAGNGEGGTRGGPPGDLYVYLTRRAASRLQARRARYVRRRAGELSAGGARRARSTCRSLDGRRRADAAGGNAVGNDAALARARHAERARRASRRPSRYASTSSFRRSSTGGSASCSKSTPTPAATPSRSAPSSSG